MYLNVKQDFCGLKIYNIQCIIIYYNFIVLRIPGERRLVTALPPGGLFEESCIGSNEELKEAVNCSFIIIVKYVYYRLWIS